MNLPRFLSFALLLLACVSVGCRRIEQGQGNSNLIVVKVAPARAGELPEVLTFVGTLRATRRASVASSQGGTVVRVAVSDGESVTAGQPLVWLETHEVEAKIAEQQAAVEGARAHVTELQATVSAAEDKWNNSIRQAQQDLEQANISIHSTETQLAANKTNFNRLTTLYKEKAVSRSQLDSAELQYKLSQDQLKSGYSKRTSAESSLRLARQGLHDVDAQRAQLEGARAALAQSEASVNSLRVQMQGSVLHAPMTGTVVQRTVEPGQAVSGGGLLTIVDNTRLECVTSVDEQYAGRLRPGMLAEVQTPVAADRKLFATVVDIIPSSDTKTNTLRVRLRIENRDHVLVDGLAINGRVTISEHKGVLMPREAVHVDGKDRYVYAVLGDVVHQKKIRVDYENQTNVLVSGVEPGVFVVIDGSNLRDGQPVTVDYTPPKEQPSETPLPEARPRASSAPRAHPAAGEPDARH